jgi:hypothetical protein
MMRAFTLAALAAGILGAAPITASAATIFEDFSVGFGFATGVSGLGEIPQFDPNFGTLQGVSISVVGSMVIIPRFTPGTAAVLELFAGGRNIFGNPNAEQGVGGSDSFQPETVSVSLHFEDSGPQYLGTGFAGLLTFAISETGADVGLGSQDLRGRATYDFTPAVPIVPEPSTWAMMLLGFAGLGFAGYRRALRTA